MVSYKGYLIYGKALLIRPNLQAWRSLGVICAKTSRGSIIEIRHIEGTVFKTREAAEDNAWKYAKTGSTKIFQVLRRKNVGSLGLFRPASGCEIGRFENLN